MSEAGTRRWVLQALGQLATAVVLDAGRFGWSGPQQPAAAHLLVGLIPDPISAAVVGRAYLVNHPEEASVATLVDRIWRGLPDLRAGDDLHAARRLLARRIREDFGREEVVQVRGWVLSRTEARLAALAALG